MESTVTRHRDNSTIECDFEGLKVEAMRKKGQAFEGGPWRLHGTGDNQTNRLDAQPGTGHGEDSSVVEKSNPPGDLITTAVRFEKGRRIQRE